MVRSSLRVALCVVLGVFAGSLLGPLFVPDPTSMLAAVITVGVSAVISVLLYRSTWLQGRGAEA
jgi:hypothetical protein